MPRLTVNLAKNTVFSVGNVSHGRTVSLHKKWYEKKFQNVSVMLVQFPSVAANHSTMDEPTQITSGKKNVNANTLSAAPSINRMM